jgi:ligand-binding SRPBCC domain-containing protein
VDGSFEISTSVAAAADRMWQWATSIEGIRYELSPWVGMSVPAGVDAEAFRARLSASDVPLPLVIGRSWVTLFRVLPLEWDDMVIVELEPGRRFLERSSMISLRVWQHERIIEPCEHGARVTDRLSWEARTALVRAPARQIVPALFRHRHARLAARFA